ncbi:hypothetical protein AR687_21280 [Flavobacteriaceae bacterium CRH]|nr:hypothetical protein AR687_21280 [Flavobacteriaceae bacterium CRH]
MEHFIVVDSATIQCKYGSVESNFLDFEDHGFKIEDKNPIIDSNVNICDFLFCRLHKRSCEFKALDKKWKNSANCGTTDGHFITTRSVLLCEEGGVVSITDAGQNITFEEDGMLKFIDFD